MIAFADAYDLMLASAPDTGTESVALAGAADRILAQDVVADMDMPPFAKAAMDGFACRREDLEVPLSVIESIPAGQMPSLTVGPGQCSRIMTGAPVPQGADCVIMQEHTESPAPGVVRFVGKSIETNICRRGEDVAKGDTVLRRGDRIGPAQIAVLATFGVARPLVARRPRVSVAATGSELVPVAQRPAGAMIRDSNSSQLCMQVHDAGALADFVGVIPDSTERLASAIREGMEGHDLVLLSGGVSTGAFDFVPDALRKNGFELLFESVAMQPGKPMVFGKGPQGVFCCGLPGNPVATCVVFELMLKPFLLRMMGHNHRPLVVRARMGEAFSRRKAERQTTIPVRFSRPDTVTPVPYHGSAHIHAMCVAEALLVIPAGITKIAEGDSVDVRLL